VQAAIVLLDSMTASENRYFLGLSISILFGLLTSPANWTASPAVAQLTPDNSLGTERSLLQGSVITGGAQRGANLFHSFSDFNVDSGQTIYFANPSGVDRILTRITGNSRSNILGTLGVQGTADLFLMNPNGILFGPNARLDVQGAFVASTANRVLFDQGVAFSTVNPQAPPLLTLNLPIGLQIGATPGGSLINQSRATDANNQIVGLQVAPGKTIAFVGGDILLAGGYLTAKQGRVELGSVESGQVSLTPINSGWQLGYAGVRQFRDIQLTQASRATIAGNGGNAIQVQAKRLSLTEGSQLDANTLGSTPGGALTVNATDSITLTGQNVDNTMPSGLVARTGGAGQAGTITISTQQLFVRDRATISAATFSSGDGGNINIQATDRVEVAGSDDSLASSVTANAQPGTSGNSGNVTIRTGTLVVRDGGQVGTSSFGSGNAGRLTIVAADAVDVSGVNPADTFSSVLASQSDQTSTGFGGSLSITTRNLTIRDGAFVSASNRGLGRAGNLDIIATESVKVTGVSPIVDYPTYLQIDGLGRGGAGDLRITTPFLLVSDGAIVTASSIFGEGGNIIINAESVLLRREGQIISDADPSANAFPRPDITIPSTANGGNTIINADNLLLAEKSKITANAVQGQGGSVQIGTQSFFLLSGSEITASSEFGIDGSVTVQTPDLDLSRGLVALPTNLTDVSRQIAQRCAADVASRNSQFVITGRGGVPTNPTAPLIAETIWQDFDVLLAERSDVGEGQREAVTRGNTPSPAHPPDLIEAQRWEVLPDGAIALTIASSALHYSSMMQCRHGK
jgi:filamentous hemagglutinin family protein